jgi:hypothetical protein
MTEYDGESGGKDTFENEPMLDDNRTVDDPHLSGSTPFSNKDYASSPAQVLGMPVENQPTSGIAPSPTPQRKMGRYVLYAVFLLIGVIVGVVGILLFQLAIGGNRAPLPVGTPTASSGNVTVHADASVIIPLLENSVQQIVLPANGSISSVQVQFTNGSQMNISGDYQISLLGVPVTQPFTLNAQLLVNNCQLQVHILQANFNNISVTGLVALFEDRINQRLAQLVPQNNLPGNVELCLTSLTTDTQGINATFELVVPSSSTPTANIKKPMFLL